MGNAYRTPGFFTTGSYRNYRVSTVLNDPRFSLFRKPVLRQYLSRLCARACWPFQKPVVESLDEGVPSGIVEPVDFSMRAICLSRASWLVSMFYQRTTRADLDLPRPVEVQVLAEALWEHPSALLTGPSGAGKPALMWRIARALSGGYAQAGCCCCLNTAWRSRDGSCYRSPPSTSRCCAPTTWAAPPWVGWVEMAGEFIDRTLEA